MVENFSQKVVQKLIKQGAIEAFEYEIYYHGVNQMITNIMDTVIILFVALCLKQVVFACAFLICFTSIRQYAGGFHAKTPIRCFGTTIVFFLSAILAAKYYSVWQQFLIGIWVISGCIICFFAPVQNGNKPLDDIEKRVYRKRTWCVWLFQSAIMFICIINKQHEFYAGIVVAQSCSALAICMEVNVRR